MNEISIFEPNRFPRQALFPMNPEWAAVFGESLAQMDPWLRLGYSPASLTRYFSSITPDRQTWVILDREAPANAVELSPKVRPPRKLSPHGGGLGWGRPNSVVAGSDPALTSPPVDRPHPGLPPWGEGVNSTALEAPAACLTVRPDWLRGPLLELLAVLPQHQGKGIGKDLISWLAGESRRQGKANLWTIGSEFNHTALAFYRRQGFEEAGVLPDLISAGETERLLRLRL